MLEEISKIDSNIKPRLLLHSCCAPCSSHVILLLSNYFNLEILFYNPNINPEEEYLKRLEEQIRMVKEMGLNFTVVDKGHKSECFYNAVKGYELLGEGSERCNKCFTLRLEESAKYASINNFDYYTTSLTISPLKNTKILNEIGEMLGNKYNIKFLNSDFKKNNGYKKSTELSKQYNLYRQPYCGCVFSKNEYNIRVKNQRD